MPQIRRKAKVDIEPIITRLLSYHSQRELAKQLGVDRSTIRRRTKVKVPIARLAHIILLHDEHKNITLKQLFTEHFAFENTYLQKPQINLNSPKNRPFLELLDKYSQFNHHQWSQWFTEKEAR